MPQSRAPWEGLLTLRRRPFLSFWVVSTIRVVVGLDDTIERRWGAKISVRAIYRDPVRSSRGHVVPPPSAGGGLRAAVALALRAG